MPDHTEVQRDTPQPSQPIVQGDLAGTTLLNRYKILRQLGEGGMGTVYLAEHTTIQKKFAIKVLSGEYAHKPDLVERFLQEARAASMIPQQNVVEISDFGDTPDGSVFFVMEHLDGEDLSDTLKREGGLPWQRIVPIMEQVCDALAAAHDAGIIHRDMKPENCFRITRGETSDFIKVLDFGIAKVTDAAGEGKGLTRTGMIFGTPEYMSPEQAQGQKVDHRVDVYAAGVILYELLTGRVPFKADTFMAILTKHMFEVPEAPSTIAPDLGITAEMEAIVLKAMQKDRDYRFADMREMKAAIQAVGTGAAAVHVVHENIARPQQGQMTFVPGPNHPGHPGTNPGTNPPAHGQPHGATYPPPGTGTYPGGGTRPPHGGTYPPSGQSYAPGVYGHEERRRSPLGFVAAGVAVLGLAGAGAFFAVSTGAEATPPAIADAAPEEAPEVDTPPVVEAPPPEKKVIAPAVPTVHFTIQTAVPAQILDASDGALFGMTNDESGFEIEKGSEAVRLALVAEGHERLEFDTVPNRDKVFEKQLVAQKAETRGKRTKKAQRGTTSAPQTAKPAGQQADAPAVPPPPSADSMPPKESVTDSHDAKPEAAPAKKKKKTEWKPEPLDSTKKKKKAVELLDPF